jgi:hypothetical protein
VLTFLLAALRRDMKRLLCSSSIALIAAGLLLAYGCSQPGNGSSPKSRCAQPPHVPASHRATADTCTPGRPASLPGAPQGDAGSRVCSSDSQCTSGMNGRCTVRQNTGLYPCSVPPFDPGCYTCTYDTCFADSDCASTVCDCRGAATHGGGQNGCFGLGNCRLDSDCSGPVPYCSPSFCTEPHGGAGFFCHTATDECTDDSDCCEDGGGTHCVFDT